MLFLFFFPREFCIWEDCVEQAVEMLQDVLLYDDERVVKAIFSNSCRTSSATKPETAYVEIFKDRISPNDLDNFELKTDTQVDSLGEPYDYDSIMHYRADAFAKSGENETIRPTQCCPRPPIGQRIKLSRSDIRQANMLYKCPSCGQTLLEFSGKFASPNAKPIRRRADANDRQQGSELPAQQKSEETIIKGAGKSQELSSINILPSQRQSELASSDSTTSDPVSCQWRIAAARGERIRLKFTHMGMVSPASDPSHCIEEYVEVRDGYHAGSPLIGRYCGTNIPQSLVSSSPRMLIDYTRSAGQQSSGFVAKYTACGQTLLEFSGTFASPHGKAIRQRADANGRQQGSKLPAQQESEEAILEGPGKGQGLSSINVLPSYRQSELASSDSATSDPVSCQWRIAAAREERIRLKFTHMGMVSPASDPSHCIEEYVEVRDGYHAGSPLIGKL
ncbi:Bone morphoproteintic protein 1 [Sparganum proliferum]